MEILTGKRIKGWQVCQRSIKKPNMFVVVCRYCGNLKLVQEKEINNKLAACDCGHWQQDKLDSETLELKHCSNLTGTYCKYPASKCFKNLRYGGCCYFCTKRDYCTDGCINTPDKCGSFKY